MNKEFLEEIKNAVNNYTAGAKMYVYVMYADQVDTLPYGIWNEFIVPAAFAKQVYLKAFIDENQPLEWMGFKRFLILRGISEIYDRLVKEDMSDDEVADMYENVHDFLSSYTSTSIWDIPWVSSKPMMELKINETTEMITGLKL